jgi:hypothetical protein
VLSVDVMDVSGAHQDNVDHFMHKSRLDSDGKLLEKTKSGIGENIRDDTRKAAAADYCGNCYGAVMPPNGCCNTCEDVRTAYRNSGWTFTEPDKFEQCKNEGFSKLMEEQANEGCNVEGFMMVSKVQGNFHFAPGSSFEVQGYHAHDLNDFEKYHDKWRFGHQIHHLSFGEKVAGLANPLDNVEKNATKGI